MPFQFKATVSRVGNSNMLILPRPLCDQYGIEKGDELLLVATENGLYIPRKAKPIDSPLIESIENEINPKKERTQKMTEVRKH